jgi:sugar lactone lactonase YvrE
MIQHGSRLWKGALVALGTALIVAPFLAPETVAAVGQVSVFASGLNNPRGLRFGPDGNLYVAEGGTGGTDSTVGLCDQVIPPVGPYTGGMTGRISRISPGGVRSTVAKDLPSSQTSPALGSLVSGVADVEFMGGSLYALVAGAGCSHGIANFPNSIIRVNVNTGAWTQVADLSEWSLNHPVANAEEDDFEPDGTYYSMTSVRGDLYAVEPNHGEVVKVTTGGTVSRLIDVSASQGHVVPTAIAYRGNFFIGNLDTFPIGPNVSKVWKVTPSGQIQTWAEGFSTVLGLLIDARSRMYVLENTVGAMGPTPGAGRIVRVDPSGRASVIAAGLSLPTAMTFGPDGNLYVSAWGFGAQPGDGQIVKVIVPAD